MVETVQGAIDSKDLGTTLMHEHLLIDRSKLWEDPIGPKKNFAKKPIKMDMLGDLRLNPYGNYDNSIMIDVDLACREASYYYNHGGNTIVDVTPVGIGRDPQALLEISKRTNLNIIMGSGYYLHNTIPEEVSKMSIEEMKESIMKDLLVGVDNTNIKAGIIGEIGVSPQKTDLEIKVLKAAARAQKETNKTLSIHTPGWERYCHEILDIVEAEGGDLKRTILGHMNPSYEDVDYQTSLAERGCYLEYDMIGIDLLFPEGQSPSDEANALAIVNLLHSGFEKNILLSQDVFLKILLKEYGGFGYAHILKNFVPRLKEKGVTNKEIERLLVYNPRESFGG